MCAICLAIDTRVYTYISATALLAVRRASAHSCCCAPPVWDSCLQVPGVLGLGEPDLGRSWSSGWAWRVVLGTPHPRSYFTRCYSVPLKSGQKQHFKKSTQKCTKYAKRLSSWGPEGVENHHKTDFLPKCAMCVWHDKNHTIQLFSLCHITTKPQEKGNKNKRFRRCVC